MTGDGQYAWQRIIDVERLRPAFPPATEQSIKAEYFYRRPESEAEIKSLLAMRQKAETEKLWDDVRELQRQEDAVRETRRSERSALLGAIAMGAIQGASQASSEYQADRAQQDAFLADTARKANAAAEATQHQRAREEQARREATQPASVSNTAINSTAADRDRALREAAAAERKRLQEQRQQQATATTTLSHMASTSMTKPAAPVAPETTSSVAAVSAVPTLVGARSAGEATNSDDDAMLCVSDPITYPNPNQKGQTVAKVSNNCPRPVDMRGCLLRNSGQWNCYTTWGVAPGKDWSWSSFDASGKVFHDAAFTEGRKRQLASPN